MTKTMHRRTFPGSVLDCLGGKRSAELLEFFDRRGLQLARVDEYRSAREPESETTDHVPIAPQACPFGALHGTRQMTLARRRLPANLTIGAVDPHMHDTWWK
jgi:hypothetical protein